MCLLLLRQSSQGQATLCQEILQAEHLLRSALMTLQSNYPIGVVFLAPCLQTIYQVVAKAYNISNVERTICIEHHDSFILVSHLSLDIILPLLCRSHVNIALTLV